MKLSRWELAVTTCSLLIVAARADMPASFDLRSYNGANYVTSIKSQSGGTCWTHGAMAAIEGNLLMTGVWAANGETGEPNLAEYHLDWWNGFNQYQNDDLYPPWGNGLVVHEGGDYLVTAAYLARGDGPVREIDGQSYAYPPPRDDAGFHHYYPRHIEWYVANPNLSNINAIKNAIVTYGIVGTCMCSDNRFMSGSYVHYQPPSDSTLPNHAVAIIGWDDNKVTQAPLPGAWRVKNSWGDGWGLSGFFWISYYDKWCCQHPEMGAISYVDVEPLRYQHFYYLDYHGWRDTKTDASEAFNAFVAEGDEMLTAVSFYTAAENVTYTAKVYDRFEGGQLLDERASVSGTFAHRGLHTVDLARPLGLVSGDSFYIYLNVSQGGQPFDRSSDIPVLLGASVRTWVMSSASAGESYYRSGGNWVDLTTYNDSANFCMKGLAVDYQALSFEFPDGLPETVGPGLPTEISVRVIDQAEDQVPASGMLHYRYASGEFTTAALVPLGGNLYSATLPAAGCGDVPEFYFSMAGSGGRTALSPADAPTAVHTATVGYEAIAFSDNFQTNQGWSVQNVSLAAGGWERAVPAGDGSRGDPLTDYDGSGACYLTGNWLGDSDVDGGPTRLISPAFDMSARGLYRLGYAHWFFNDNGDGDVLSVDLSNNNGASWVNVRRHERHAGWSYEWINVPDYVTPTATVKIRFSLEDNPSNSVDEAAIDAIELVSAACVYRGDLNCDDIVDFGDINPFVTALLDPAAYHAAYPECDVDLADIDNSGTVDFGDINPFVTLLLN